MQAEVQDRGYWYKYTVHWNKMEAVVQSVIKFQPFHFPVSQGTIMQLSASIKCDTQQRRWIHKHKYVSVNIPQFQPNEIKITFKSDKIRQIATT